MLGSLLPVKASVAAQVDTLEASIVYLIAGGFFVASMMDKDDADRALYAQVAQAGAVLFAGLSIPVAITLASLRSNPSSGGEMMNTCCAPVAAA